MSNCPLGAQATYRCFQIRLQWYLVIHLGRFHICCQWQDWGVCILPLIEGIEAPPYLLHIRLGRVGCPLRRVPIPEFQYCIRSAGVGPSCGRLHTRHDISGFLLCSSPRVLQKGLEDCSGKTPRHVAAVSRVLAQGCTLINQPDGIGGNPEGERGELQYGGGQVPRSLGSGTLRLPR